MNNAQITVDNIQSTMYDQSTQYEKKIILLLNDNNTLVTTLRCVIMI
jgi:hypothetical protein